MITLLLRLLLLCFCLIPLANAAPPRGCKVVIAGAGIGGVYVAHRLVEAGRFRGRDICVFEARAKPGGRILTVRGAVRGFRDYVIDLGAYRYHRSKHRLAHAVAETLLDLPFTCYDDLLPKSLYECSSEPVLNRIYSTRATVLSPAVEELREYDPDRVPFKIPPQFQWGPENPSGLTAPRSPMTMLLSATSPINAIAADWDALVTAANYSTAMDIADRIIRNLATEKYAGVPLTVLTHWELAIAEGLTNEELKLFLERDGVARADRLQTSVYLNAAYAVRNEALEKVSLVGPNKLVTPARLRAGVPRRIGMRALVDGLLRLNAARGVRVFYNHRVTHISRVGKAGMMIVSVNHKMKIRTGNVFLNTPKAEVTALGLSSQPLRSMKMPEIRTFSRVTPLTLSKTYCFWDDAWWVTKLNETRGSYLLGDGSLYLGRYHDGDVVCTAGGKCRGALLVSYIGGRFADLAKSGSALHAHNRRYLQPWRDDVKGNVRTIYDGQDHDGMLFREIHRQLRNAHRKDFARVGLDVEKHLQDARGCTYADWMDMGEHMEMGPLPPKVNPYKHFAQPVSTLNISLVNEGWSDYTGWAEGSLRSAERALHYVHKLPKPTWLDEPYHRSVIRKFNRG